VKVLIAYTNTLRMLAPAPLGASLVAARLRRDGHEVRFLDLMFARSPVAMKLFTRRAADHMRVAEKDMYFESAAMDIRALPKLEGTVHVNIALPCA
jgi:hypothetical protein